MGSVLIALAERVGCGRLRDAPHPADGIAALDPQRYCTHTFPSALLHASTPPRLPPAVSGAVTVLVTTWLTALCNTSPCCHVAVPCCMIFQAHGSHKFLLDFRIFTTLDLFWHPLHLHSIHFLASTPVPGPVTCDEPSNSSACISVNIIAFASLATSPCLAYHQPRMGTPLALRSLTFTLQALFASPGEEPRHHIEPSTRPPRRASSSSRSQPPSPTYPVYR
ncbi:hypothetical protein BHE90_010104 [Fusarium euwallaceae]|uniref:Uncharacterized protein n=1 Tax=Fusarium euwallaceae TaxID=1147111 RepID=A0A430LIB0_9HYPO|nr:hypothetical protein BHE90_010104 [Fusarium euwallaceae]